MGKIPQQRIAFVRFTPEGKSYAMKCDREDLIVGDEVEVLMYAGSNKEYFHSGEITSVSHDRWNCSCHVLNHVCEVNLSFDEKELNRIVEHSHRTKIKIDEWRSQRASLSQVYTDSSKSEMQEIYSAIAPEEGEDVYLSDGMWLTPEGDTEDRGR
jgi:hypothetical protein